MTQFRSADAFASWAGLVPECNESAGKKKSTRLRKGNKQLKSTLVECARAAIRHKDSYYYAKYCKIAARRKNGYSVSRTATERSTQMSNEVQRGQIYLTDLGQRQGSEQSGLRPVIIVQNNEGNRNSPTVIAVPITSQIKREDMPTHTRIGLDSGLVEESIALCEHIDTIDKSNLSECIGLVTGRELKKLNKALAISIGLNNKFAKENNPKVQTVKKESVRSKSDDDELLLCLCPICAAQFFNSPDHIIRRVDPLQTKKEDCTYCDVRKGYDYRIIKKKKRLGDDRP